MRLRSARVTAFVRLATPNLDRYLDRVVLEIVVHILRYTQFQCRSSRGADRRTDILSSLSFPKSLSPPKSLTVKRLRVSAARENTG